MNEILIHFVALVSLTILEGAKSVVLYVAGFRKIGNRYERTVTLSNGEQRSIILPREFAAEHAEKYLRVFLD